MWRPTRPACGAWPRKWRWARWMRASSTKPTRRRRNTPGGCGRLKSRCDQSGGAVSHRNAGGGARPAMAQAFVDFTRSDAGQAILREHGFAPPADVACPCAVLPGTVRAEAVLAGSEVLLEGGAGRRLESCRRPESGWAESGDDAVAALGRENGWRPLSESIAGGDGGSAGAGGGSGYRHLCSVHRAAHSGAAGAGRAAGGLLGRG